MSKSKRERKKKADTKDFILDFQSVISKYKYLQNFKLNHFVEEHKLEPGEFDQEKLPKSNEGKEDVVHNSMIMYENLDL